MYKEKKFTKLHLEVESARLDSPLVWPSLKALCLSHIMVDSIMADSVVAGMCVRERHHV